MFSQQKTHFFTNKFDSSYKSNKMIFKSINKTNNRNNNFLILLIIESIFILPMY